MSVRVGGWGHVSGKVKDGKSERVRVGGWGHVSGRVKDGRSEGVRVGAWSVRGKG